MSERQSNTDFINSQNLESKLYFLAMVDGVQVEIDGAGNWNLTFSDGRVVIGKVLEDAVNIAMEYEMKEIDDFVAEIADRTAP